MTKISENTPVKYQSLNAVYGNNCCSMQEFYGMCMVQVHALWTETQRVCN